ncbi:MAG: lysozyme inhibitor [Leptolyngbya sp. SIOISBB]|nr:lysozyme inhibitor [Leptolyngbya sp. SIOISBB]
MKKATSMAGVALLTSLSLVGCNTAQIDTATGQGSLVTYQCKDGTEFTARLSANEAVADLPDRPNLALPLVESESGTTYSDGSTKLLIDGEKAVVEVNNAIVLTECTLATATAEPSTPDSTQSHNPSTENSNQSTNSSGASNSSRPNGTRTQRVQFAAGSTSTTVEDVIVGYEMVDYVLGAQAGQYANVSMATDNPSNYFNILPPGSDQAIFMGSVNGNQYEGTLPANGDYRIRVYLMRNAARRDEAADYRLEMIIFGGGGGTSGGRNVEGDALVPGTPYNATGDIPCVIGRDGADNFCAFGVVREGGGDGFVEVTNPNGSTISIYFQNGVAVSAEGRSGAFSATRQGDETIVFIGEDRYALPDAVIYGG